jgi:hypothetical protein
MRVIKCWRISQVSKAMPPAPKDKPASKGETDGCGEGGDQGKAKVCDVERSDEPGIHRVVVLEYQQGNGAQQKIGRYCQQDHGEEQGQHLGLQCHVVSPS